MNKCIYTNYTASRFILSLLTMYKISVIFHKLPFSRSKQFCRVGIHEKEIKCLFSVYVQVLFQDLGFLLIYRHFPNIEYKVATFVGFQLSK